MIRRTGIEFRSSNLECGISHKGVSDLDNLHVLNLRGKTGMITDARIEQMSQIIREGAYQAFFIDPIYKLLAGRPENANEEITAVLQPFDKLTVETKNYELSPRGAEKYALWMAARNAWSSNGLTKNAKAPPCNARARVAGSSRPVIITTRVRGDNSRSCFCTSMPFFPGIEKSMTTNVMACSRA